MFEPPSFRQVRFARQGLRAKLADRAGQLAVLRQVRRHHNPHRSCEPHCGAVRVLMPTDSL